MQDDTATPLDAAHAAMIDAPEDDVARLRYYARLADGMLWLWTEAEAAAGEVRPQVFPTEDGPLVLAFDTEARLSEAAGDVVTYAAMPGRVVARALAGQGVALGVNLGAQAPGFLVPPEALDWLATTLDHAPEEAEARPVEFSAPAALPAALLAALDDKLARAGGLAAGAVIAGVRYEGGRRGHMLAFLDAAAGAEVALARAVSEALTFSGLEAGQLDVTFLAGDAPSARAMARAGLRIDLPEPPAPVAPVPPAPPGTQGPPRLR